jgi:DNA-binding NarL/FixJ family response regulator
LIVDDYEPMARAVARQIAGPRRRAILAASVGEAQEVAPAGDALTGAVVDVALPDGTGLDVVRWLRVRDPRIPILVITGAVAPSVVNQCQILGCEFVFKPASAENLRAFADRASWSRRLGQDELGRYAHDYSAARRLTPREREVLALALAGLKRGAIAQRLGVGENTVKMQIRSMLRKTGHNNLGELIVAVLRGAWLKAG